MVSLARLVISMVLRWVTCASRLQRWASHALSAGRESRGPPSVHCPPFDPESASASFARAGTVKLTVIGASWAVRRPRFPRFGLNRRTSPAARARMNDREESDSWRLALSGGPRETGSR